MERKKNVSHDLQYLSVGCIQVSYSGLQSQEESFLFFWRRIKKVLESDVYHKKISLRYTGGAWKQTVGWEITSREFTETFSKMSLAAHRNILCVCLKFYAEPETITAS